MKYKLTNFSESRVGGALLRHFSNKGTEFEIKVERTLRALSCDLIQTPASQDGGIDHNGIWRFPDQKEIQIITQCKNESKPVSVETLRAFQGVLQLQVSNVVGLIASSSGYSMHAQRFFQRMRQPAILSTLEYDAIRKETENDCFTSFLLNVPAQALLPRLSIGTAFRASAVFNIETVSVAARFAKETYVLHLMALLVAYLLWRMIIPTWTTTPSPFDAPICPPIDLRVHYRYGVSQMKGRRPYMEDRHIAYAMLNGDPEQSFYGVFDGHGGAGAANYCVQALCQNIVNEPSLQKEPMEALKKGFIQTDRDYVDLAARSNAEDGSTAVVILTRGDTIYVAHAGDSRAILVNKDSDVSVLTSDHKPNRPDEKRRIQELGGSVVFWGVWRVSGVLAVSRAIGDRLLKPLVAAEPEVKKFIRTDQDLFIVVASDGVWDTISNEEAAELVTQYTNPQEAAKSLMEEAYKRGSMDNICVMVIDLTQKFTLENAQSP
ncbi:hypothetical protein ABG067_004708 [Albugo candida]